MKPQLAVDKNNLGLDLGFYKYKNLSLRFWKANGQMLMPMSILLVVDRPRPKMLV